MQTVFRRRTVRHLGYVLAAEDDEWLRLKGGLHVEREVFLEMGMFEDHEVRCRDVVGLPARRTGIQRQARLIGKKTRQAS